MWWYSDGNIITETVQDADHVHQDSHGMVFWGRRIVNQNAVSLSWDPYDTDEKTYLDVLLALEEKFGKDVKLFISSFGRGLSGPISISQAVKQINMFSENNSYFFNRNKKVSSKKLNKKADLQGEWWIQSGTAYSADGNVDDMNHEAYVIAQAQSELADGEVWDWESWKEQKALELLQEKEEEIDQGYFEGEDEEAAKYQIWEMKQDPGYYADELIEEEIKQMGGEPELLMVANGQGDARLYGMKNYGWKRVEGRHVETWTLTKGDLQSIAAGLWDAYNEGAEKALYNIEVRNPAKYYANIPYQVIEDANPAKLREYDLRPNIDPNYKPRYASWYKNAEEQEYSVYTDHAHPRNQKVKDENWGDITLWAYDQGRLKVFNQEELYYSHNYLIDAGKLTDFYSISGRYSSKKNATSIYFPSFSSSAAEVVFELESHFGSNITIHPFMDGKYLGKMDPTSLIKFLHKGKSQYELV